MNIILATTVSSTCKTNCIKTLLENEPWSPSEPTTWTPSRVLFATWPNLPRISNSSL